MAEFEEPVKNIKKKNEQKYEKHSNSSLRVIPDPGSRDSKHQFPFY